MTEVRVEIRVADAAYTVSAAARLAGMHPQTLRQWDRLGLVTPARAQGRGRRYSPQNLEDLREVQRLSVVEGVNLAGIRRILELQAENRLLRAQVERLKAVADPGRRIFAVGPSGATEPLARGQRSTSPARGTMVVWRG